jgi:hypothetical protein
MQNKTENAHNRAKRAAASAFSRMDRDGLILIFLTERPICGVVRTLLLINIINMIPEDDILCLILIQAIKEDERKNLFKKSLQASRPTKFYQTK